MTSGNRYLYSTASVALHVYAYVFLEWLFFSTKLSFLSAWAMPEQLRALVLSAIPFLIVALILHLALLSITLLIHMVRSRGNGERYLLQVVPALILVAIAVMLLDNFTYTMFGWGIVKTTWRTAPIYWVFGLLIFGWRMRRQPGSSRLALAMAVGLFAVSTTTLAWTAVRAHQQADNHYASAWTGTRLPNIIMFASDGVSADHMSAYGYARKTTPNLDAYLDGALVEENAFTNASATTGSLTSMMTGKYPTTTKVLYPPYTLTGKDARQNLPRILHKLGYRNLQETVRYFADGPDLNWEDSFNDANGREIRLSQVEKTPPELRSSLIFTDNVYQRLSGRIKQLLLMERMSDLHAAVASTSSAKVFGISDQRRMDSVFDFIRRTPGPYFIHIHLMGTHCCFYYPSSKKFSSRAFADPKERKIAQFDDTILRSDLYFGQLMDFLKKNHQLDNTLVIYSSDHGNGWDTRTQVPLIFLFPGGVPRGHGTSTTQLLDVAPTVLDYLKVKVPDWMEGRSLLQGGLKRDRPVYGVYGMEMEQYKNAANVTLERVINIGPPTYGLSSASVVVCQRWYIMWLKGGRLLSGDIDTYRNKCPDALLPDKDKARAMISKHLRERGFIF